MWQPAHLEVGPSEVPMAQAVPACPSLVFLRPTPSLTVWVLGWFPSRPSVCPRILLLFLF